MINRKSIFLLILFLSVLIIFDAFQQKYYVDTFQLTPHPVPLTRFLLSHLIRWIVWAIVAIPFILSLRKWQSKNDHSETVTQIFKSVLLIFPSVLLAIVLITVSLHLIFNPGSPFEELWGDLVFHFFQKGMVFFMAFGALAMWLHINDQAKELEANWVTIKDLRKNQKQSNEPHIVVKAGSRVQTLHLREIIWIQADDYCVRVHTESKSYYLRKSLKFLEGELAPYHFVRIHRGALLNLKHLGHIDFNKLTIQLQNDNELPLSKSGAQALKEKLKEDSL